MAFRPEPDLAIHRSAGIIGEAGSVFLRTRAFIASPVYTRLAGVLVPAKPVLRILDKAGPLAKLAAVR
jgi:hypothetical protein